MLFGVEKYLTKRPVCKSGAEMAVGTNLPKTMANCVNDWVKLKTFSDICSPSRNNACPASICAMRM